MSVRVTNDPAEFQATTFAFLERDPVLHTILMTNVAERAAGSYPATETEPSYYVSVHDDSGEVVGATMRTPNRPIHLGSLREDLAIEVADAYAELLPDAPGVAGDRVAATSFANRWSELHGTTWTETRAVRLHKLIELNQLEAEGEPRRMTESDLQRAAEWNTDGFATESPTPDLVWARHQLESGALWFWQVDGVPVSMASYHLPLFGVCRVGPVYTPPEHRGNGYAGALTAHVTAQILAQGNQACLYTDLANRTSNKLYARIGYTPVADAIDLTFSS
ncbi:GNAT family N-acetyltransferase [Kribbella sp. NPDC023855]|uniref:GNAT family N-acetyltransferase n=1 Tax=Kribbella sp. NPDC023855 TaxID=3154698 RepID=UPI0033E6C2E2